MTNREMEKRIQTAATHAAPDKLSDILSSCGKQMNHTSGKEPAADAGRQEKGRKDSMRGKRNGFVLAALAAAMVLALGLGGYFWLNRTQAPRVDSVITLDVNPSISVYVDADENVISVEALNDDAREILGNMELEGTSLEVALNALIGSMLQKGYLGDLQNAILVSVENDDALRGEALKQKVSEAVAAALKTDSMDGAVLSQTVSVNDAQLAQLASQYHISMGKAALIQEVTAGDPTLDFGTLAAMSINEIALISASRDLLPGTLTQIGTASDAAYIGAEKALELACTHAQVAVSDAVRVKAEFDSEDGVMVYELEFMVGAVQYEYDIDARTGAVLSYEYKGGSAFENNTEIPDQTQPGMDVETPSQPEPPQAPSESPTRPEPVTQPETSPVMAGDGCIGETAARDAALTHAGCAQEDTVYLSCYLEYEDGRPEHYDVEFVVGNTEYEYEIDPYTGAVLECSSEVLEGIYGNGAGQGNGAAGNGNPAPGNHHGSHHHYGVAGCESCWNNCIGAGAALTAALNHAGVAEESLTGRDVELEEDDGRLLYEIEFKARGMEYEYEVDALTGEILKSESERDD